MSIRRLLSRMTTGAMDFYSQRMYVHTFDVEYRAAATFLKRHPQPGLSQGDKEEIDRYWRQFGIKYPDYTWFEMYYGVTGIHDPRFIPDWLAWPPIYWHYNDKTCLAGWEDKNLAPHLIPDIAFPIDLVHIYRGKVYDKDWNYCAPDDIHRLSKDIFEEIQDDGCIVLKATRSTQASKGVKLLTVNSPEDIATAISNNLGVDHVLERFLKQSSFTMQFCTSSVNIFRVVTWRHQGRIDVLKVCVRYGIEGHNTDITYVNGQEILHAVGIDSEGMINGRFVSLDGNAPVPEHYHDPQVPNLEAVIAMAKRGHQSLYPFDLVGWDIALDQDNNPLCVEYNLFRPGTIVYQFTSGPLAGDLTDEFLEFLNMGDNLEKFIPKKYRTR